MINLETLREVIVPLILGGIMLAGLVSLIIPIMPGLWLIWGAVLVYAFVDGLNWISGILFFFITVLMIAGGLADNVLMGAGARKTGASWLSVGVAMVGAVIGSIVLPPLGGVIFAMVGIFLVEYIRIRDWRRALDSTRHLALGCGWSVVARIGFGIVMILLWLIWVFWV